MSKIDRLVADALRRANATLVRQAKHLIYRFPNGHSISVSQRASLPKTTGGTQ